MELTDHLRIVAHNWWRILLGSIVVAAIVFGVSSQRSDEFEATTILDVTIGGGTSSSSLEATTLFVTARYSERATTKPVLVAAIQNANLPTSPRTLEDHVKAFPSGSVGFLAVVGSADTPRGAARIANAVARAVIDDVTTQQAKSIDDDLRAVNDEIASVRKQLDGLAVNAPERPAILALYQALTQAATERRTQPQNRLEIVADATRPAVPVAPRPKRDAAFSFIAALIVLAEASVLVHVLADRFPRNADATVITAITGLPVFAQVPRGPDLQTTEAFRALRSNLLMLPAPERQRSIAIVAANANAGKTFVATHAAEALALQGLQVILIDGDLRRPTVDQRLGTPRTPGLSEALRQEAVAQTIHPVRLDTANTSAAARLLVIPSGRPTADPTGPLSDGSFHKLLQGLHDMTDLVLIDTPPIDLFADAQIIAMEADGAIFVIDLKSSRRRAVLNAMESLRRSNVNLIGVVVNGSATKHHGAYREYRRR